MAIHDSTASTPSRSLMVNAPTDTAVASVLFALVSSSTRTKYASRCSAYSVAGNMLPCSPGTGASGGSLYVYQELAVSPVERRLERSEAS